jgi:TRAP-type C4-dicarboxylate transport system substrate-binding protein
VWFWTDDESTWTAMKLVGVPVQMTALAELGAWLRDKKLDAWAFPPLAVIAFQLQRYSRYMADMPLTFLAGAFVLRKDVFDALPKDAQRAIRTVGRKWESRIIKVWRAENDRAIAALEKQGTRIVRWSDAERQKFFQATAAQRGEFARRWGLEALMRRISEDLEGFREATR